VTTASSPVRALASPFLRAERWLEELDAACDNAPICATDMGATDRNRKAREGRFERELKSYEAHQAQVNHQAAVATQPRGDAMRLD
jgi:hypothetical protein